MVKDKAFLHELFRKALELPEPQREPFLEDACGNDVALLDRLRRMLSAACDDSQDRSGEFDRIRNGLLSSMFDDSAPASEDLSGTLIQAWQIESPIARGGLATVYLAHRADGQYSRQVALKVLRRGLDTDDLIRRFRAERQILSSLHHPAIAQLLDGGALKDGRPFLVMEFVDGLPINEFCKTKQLEIDARIRLVIEVLDAVHHAHQHLVVHRDIKPSNILVSHEGRVTLLDFGIAKILDVGSIPVEISHTRTGVSLLTPGYGSPEQKMGHSVTTASDVYQVGGILFELLAQSPPETLDQSAAHLPGKPPSRFAGSKQLAAELRGDLDAIVCKAMHGDPGQRYASANAMLADLNRYLNREPVLARPDSLWYRFSKLSQRNRWLVPVVAAAITLLATYIYTLNRYNQQILTEQQRANAATTFMADLLSSADPYSPADPEKGKSLTVVEALDFGLSRLRTAFYGKDDRLRASLLVSISDGFANLDEHMKTIDARSEALELERMLYGDVSEPVIRSLRLLAIENRTIGRYDLAESLYLEMYESSRKLFKTGHPELAVAQLEYGHYLQRVGRIPESIDLMESAVEIFRTAPAEYSDHRVNAIVWLSRLHPDSRAEEMLALLYEAKMISDGGHSESTLLGGLVDTQTAVVLTQLGEFEQAEATFHEAIAVYEKDLGRSHGATLVALTGLGNMYYQSGDYARAEAVYSEVHQHYLEKYGTAHRGVAGSQEYLGRIFEAQGRWYDAMRAYRLSFDSEMAVLGPDSPLSYRGLLLEAQAMIEAGDSGRASEALLAIITLIDPLENGAQVKSQAECLYARASSEPATQPGAEDCL